MVASIESVTLGELIDKGAIQVTTGFPFGGHNNEGAGVPHIRPFNVGIDGDIHLDQIKSIPATAAIGKAQLQQQDILFNNTNTKELVGKCALWLNQSNPVFSNHMTRIRVINDSLDPTYLSFAILYHWMTGKSEMLARSHVAQASIIGARFREIEVPKFSISEQRSIGSLVEQVRTASRSETVQLKHTQELKQATMRELFKHDTTKSQTTLNQLCDLTTIQCDPAHISETATYLGLEHLAPGCMRSIEKGQARDIKSHKFIFQQNDVLYSKLRPYLDKAVLADSDGICTTELLVLRTRPDINPQYLACVVHTSDFIVYAMSGITGAHHPRTSWNHISQFKLPAHDNKEQTTIATLLFAIEQKIYLHKQKRTALEELFKSLLCKLMAGEIRVCDLNLSELPSNETIA